MMMPAKQKAYKTEKLTFAAYLIASGKAQLVGTERYGSGTNVLFVLSEVPTEFELTEFFNGSAQVSALRFSEAMNTLKSIAHEGRRCHG
jgi:hypothetical protein